MLTAGILASAVAGLGAAAFFAGGEPQAPGPKVTPAVDTFLVQHAIVTGDLPVTPASGTSGGSSGRGPGGRAQPGRGERACQRRPGAAGSAVPPGRQPRPAPSRAATRRRRRQSARGRSASLLAAAGMMRRGLPQRPPGPALAPVAAGPGDRDREPGAVS